MNHIVDHPTENKTRVICTEVYSRVSGYFRPVAQWNRGKQDEFSERAFADVSRIAAQIA